MYKINPKKATILIVALFIAVFGTDMLVHSMLLGEDYKATETVWRAEESMTQFMPFMMIGQLLMAIAFGLLYCKGFANGKWDGALFLGFMMAVVAAGASFVYYAVLPITLVILMKWVIGGLAQMLVLGAVAKLVYGRGARVQ